MARKTSIKRVILWVVLVLAMVVVLAAAIPLAVWLGTLYDASARAAANRTPGPFAAIAAVNFHEKYYNVSRESVAYDEATPEFKAEMSRADFLRLMETMHRQLGDWRYTALGDSPTTTTDGVTSVNIACASCFAKGNAAETMRYVVSDQKANLRDFHIELPGPSASPAANL